MRRTYWLVPLISLFTLPACVAKEASQSISYQYKKDPNCAMRFQDNHQRRPYLNNSPERPPNIAPEESTNWHGYAADFMPTMKDHFETSIAFYCHAGMPLDTYKATVFKDYPPEAKLRSYQIQGKNWKGIAYTSYDTTGDDAQRSLSLGFYIPKADGRYALEGEATPVGIKGNKNNDVVSQVIQLLESIEFVDVTPPAAAPDTK